MIAGSSFDAALSARVKRAQAMASAALLAARDGAPHWTGELSASALSTATAVTALTLVARANPAETERLEGKIRRGFAWLAANQNADGGWGDTTRSKSNISTTTLVWAAFGLADKSTPGIHAATATAERWLKGAAGSIEPDALVAAIERRYGDDRTFSIPILTMCALCGRLGPDGWRHVRQLPFELAALPQRWFGAIQLPVVSYALPALIAIGQVRHVRRRTKNPFARLLRDRCRARTLEKLAQLQPANGGFLEATPLTSFVTMSLAGLGLPEHPVARRGADFLLASARPDGSWPIDTNLATWVTTLAVNALAPDQNEASLPSADRLALRDWLLRQQFRQTHPYTLAAPGGWAWTDLPGGVPDADDTAGAILALTRLDPPDADAQTAMRAGAQWLLDLQNRDGGMPTFCRGWGKLPFDRSSPDITAHAIRAWLAARVIVAGPVQRRLARATARAVEFLLRTQRRDGTWIPLWFGHENHPADENPLYGTTRVLHALACVDQCATPPVATAIDRGLDWLMAKQNPDGGWSGSPQARSSVEETGLAVEALIVTWQLACSPQPEHIAALRRGAEWLAHAIETESWREPAPIGFYFAKLWYFEKLYPLIFATGALTSLALPR